MFELSKSLGYSVCHLSENANMFLSSCSTHYGAIQMGSITITLTAALLMAFVSVGSMSWSASVR